MKTLLISKLLKKYNLKPSKRLGQNFLIDKSVLKKIIEAADLTREDIVLEIGPGLGILTLELTKKVKKVIAIEKDRILCQVLRDILRAEKINNVEVINNDVLKMTNDQFPMTNQIPNTNYKIVANLPYYITSPVIRKFLETKNPPRLMVLMLQKEVAQRICAAPPRMNLLAVAVQFYSDSQIISYVSKKSFYPQPRVDSAIIKIIPRKSALLSALFCDKFFELVKMGFSSKRKMLKNNLPEIDFEKLGLNSKIRAENLSISEWLKVFHSVDFLDF